MDETLLITLRTLRPLVRLTWEQRLRGRPPRSALASPDTLVYMMDWTLDRLIAALGSEPPPVTRRRRARSLGIHYLDTCACARNPFIDYFDAAEEAIMAVLPQRLSLCAREEQVAKVRRELHRQAADEITAFCELCRSRTELNSPARLAGECVRDTPSEILPPLS